MSVVTGPDNQNELSDTTKTALKHMTERVLTVAGKLA